MGRQCHTDHASHLLLETCLNGVCLACRGGCDEYECQKKVYQGLLSCHWCCLLQHPEAKLWPLHVQVCRCRTMHLVLSWPP